MPGRLRLETPVVNAHDLLVYRVLLRDQPAIVDLVSAVLSPLVQARGGAQPLLDTLDAYYRTGGVATESARRLHLSVRTITYRLDRIKTLTGCDPTDPEDRLTLRAAAVGAKALQLARRATTHRRVTAPTPHQPPLAPPTAAPA
jgi:DNA-binding PucR family transcriptional regulator